jgi:hypothetical protein
MRAALLLASGLSFAVLTSAARAEPPAPPSTPPARLVELTDDEARTARLLLLHACRSTQGEEGGACEAAVDLRRKIADGKPVEPTKAEPAKPEPAPER